jgi:lipoate-protein ligase A
MIIEIPDLKIRSPYISIAIEEVLAEYYSKMDDFDALLRLWLNPPTIVLGRTCKVLENIHAEVLSSIFNHSRNKIYLTRRLSGGGTVYHSQGILNYTIMIPLKKYKEFYSIKDSYQIILTFLLKALEKQNIFGTILGLSDLSIKIDGEYKKFSGNSQFRKYNMLVHHGTLILNEKVINEIEKVLKHPPKEPDYRKKRTHKEFLTSLPENFDVSLFYSCLLDEIKNYFNVIESRFITPKEFKEMKPILLKKVKNVYKNSNWILKGKYELKEIIAENNPRRNQ